MTGILHALFSHKLNQVEKRRSVLMQKLLYFKSISLFMPMWTGYMGRSGFPSVQYAWQSARPFWDSAEQGFALLTGIQSCSLSYPRCDDRTDGTFIYSGWLSTSSAARSYPSRCSSTRSRPPLILDIIFIPPECRLLQITQTWWYRAISISSKIV